MRKIHNEGNHAYLDKISTRKIVGRCYLRLALVKIRAMRVILAYLHIDVMIKKKPYCYISELIGPHIHLFTVFYTGMISKIRKHPSQWYICIPQGIM